MHNANQDIPLGAREGQNVKLKVFEFAEATLESADCSIDAAILA